MELHIVIDNIRSAYNVGSIFRTADGTGRAKLYICGISPDGKHPKVAKTALGSTETVEYKTFKTTKEAIENIRAQGITIFAVELTEGAKEYSKVDYPERVAFVFGHEIDGVSQEIISLCDKSIFVPMNGKKESLNVATVAGIVMYEAIRELS